MVVDQVVREGAGYDVLQVPVAGLLIEKAFLRRYGRFLYS